MKPPEPAAHGRSFAQTRSTARAEISRSSCSSTVSIRCWRAPGKPRSRKRRTEMAHMSAADFEALYQADPDPWGYTRSAYEREKYQATLAACGPGPFAHALELGGSIGVFSELLAPRCQSLIT